MAAIQVSRLVRLALEERWAAQFNDNLAVVAQEYGIYAQVFQVNFAEFAELPQNFFRGAWTLDRLMSFREPEIPSLAMWTGEGIPYGPGTREMPRSFSGYVVAHWRFFLGIKGRSGAKLTDLREANESAMVATIQEEFADITYRADLAWQALEEQSWIDQDDKHVGFVQQVDYAASFEVNV